MLEDMIGQHNKDSNQNIPKHAKAQCTAAYPSSEEPSKRYSVPGTGGPTVPLCPGKGPAKKLAAHVSVRP